MEQKTALVHEHIKYLRLLAREYPNISSVSTEIINLQAILDLEPQLARLDLGEAVLQEFETLKRFLGKADSVELSETDVARIEEATAHFLYELKLPLSLVDEGLSRNRLLQ